MATNFPTSLDALTNPSGTDSMSSPSHAGQHTDANDAIEALQAKVGADGSAVTTSLDYKVSQLETDVGNLESRPVETKTASYVLVAGDVNKRIVMNNAGATTITVNTGIFSAGDTVWIHNIGAGTTTVTAGTATVNTAGSLDVGQWEGGSLYFTSASSAIFFRGGGAVSYGTATGGTSSTITVGGESWTLLTFTSSSTLTVTKAGLFEILPIAGGGGGDAGGGGGGGVARGQALGSTVSSGITTYLDANTAVVVGAGGAARDGGAGYAPQLSGNVSHVGYIIAQGGGLASAYGASGGGENAAPYTYDNVGRGNGYQGYNGGSCVYNEGSGDYHSGGGGGAGGVGGNATEYSGARGGHGGVGADISAFLGQSAGTTYMGGGGGGRAYDAGHAGGNGGAGGGGRGWGSAGGAVAGSANTGGGGGGGRAAGGSGRVYVRFKN